jgi:hypothetical protein
MSFGFINHFNNYKKAAAVTCSSYATIVESAFGVDSSGGSGDSVSLTFSSAIQAGQYIVVAVMSGPGNYSINKPNFDSTWTELYSDFTGSPSVWALYVKKATGTEGTIISVQNVNTAGIIIGVKIGNVATTPLDVNNITNSSATTPSVTTTHNCELLLSIFYKQSNLLCVAPTGWTLLQTAAINSSHGGPIAVGMAWTTQSTAGASTSAAWQTNVSGPLESITLGIRSLGN